MPPTVRMVGVGNSGASGGPKGRQAELHTHIRKLKETHELIFSWSAYKCFHSTETALLKVQNDILCEIDNQKCVILLLLDMSAAFDTVDHELLLERTSKRYGVKGNV